MAGVAKQQIEKLAYYPTLSRQMYKREVQTLRPSVGTRATLPLI